MQIKKKIDRRRPAAVPPHSDSKHQKIGNKYLESRYGHILYQNYGFLGQGIHFRGFFLSKSGHDHFGGHG